MELAKPAAVKGHEDKSKASSSESNVEEDDEAGDEEEAGDEDEEILIPPTDEEEEEEEEEQADEEEQAVRPQLLSVEFENVTQYEEAWNPIKQKWVVTGVKLDARHCFFNCILRALEPEAELDHKWKSVMQRINSGLDKFIDLMPAKGLPLENVQSFTQLRAIALSLVEDARFNVKSDRYKLDEMEWATQVKKYMARTSYAKKNNGGLLEALLITLGDPDIVIFLYMFEAGKWTNSACSENPEGKRWIYVYNTGNMHWDMAVFDIAGVEGTPGIVRGKLIRQMSPKDRTKMFKSAMDAAVVAHEKMQREEEGEDEEEEEGGSLPPAPPKKRRKAKEKRKKKSKADSSAKSKKKKNKEGSSAAAAAAPAPAPASKFVANRLWPTRWRAVAEQHLYLRANPTAPVPGYLDPEHLYLWRESTLSVVHEAWWQYRDLINGAGGYTFNAWLAATRSQEWVNAGFPAPHKRLTAEEDADQSTRDKAKRYDLNPAVDDVVSYFRHRALGTAASPKRGALSRHPPFRPGATTLTDAVEEDVAAASEEDEEDPQADEPMDEEQPDPQDEEEEEEEEQPDPQGEEEEEEQDEEGEDGAEAASEEEEDTLHSKAEYMQYKTENTLALLRFSEKDNIELKFQELKELVAVRGMDWLNNCRDGAGWGCVHLAVASLNTNKAQVEQIGPRILRWLYEHDAAMNLLSNKQEKEVPGGSTCLHVAVALKRIRCVQYLLQVGDESFVNYPNAVGQSARDMVVLFRVKGDRKLFQDEFAAFDKRQEEKKKKSKDEPKEKPTKPQEEQPKKEKPAKPKDKPTKKPTKKHDESGEEEEEEKEQHRPPRWKQAAKGTDFDENDTLDTILRAIKPSKMTEYEGQDPLQLYKLTAWTSDVKTFRDLREWIAFMDRKQAAANKKYWIRDKSLYGWTLAHWIADASVKDHEAVEKMLRWLVSVTGFNLSTFGLTTAQRRGYPIGTSLATIATERHHDSEVHFINMQTPSKDAPAGAHRPAAAAAAPAASSLSDDDEEEQIKREQDRMIKAAQTAKRLKQQEAYIEKLSPAAQARQNMKRKAGASPSRPTAEGAGAPNKEARTDSAAAAAAAHFTGQDKVAKAAPATSSAEFDDTQTNELLSIYLNDENRRRRINAKIATGYGGKDKHMIQSTEWHHARKGPPLAPANMEDTIYYKNVLHDNDLYFTFWEDDFDEFILWVHAVFASKLRVPKLDPDFLEKYLLPQRKFAYWNAVELWFNGGGDRRLIDEQAATGNGGNKWETCVHRKLLWDGFHDWKNSLEYAEIQESIKARRRWFCRQVRSGELDMDNVFTPQDEPPKQVTGKKFLNYRALEADALARMAEDARMRDERRAARDAAAASPAAYAEAAAASSSSHRSSAGGPANAHRPSAGGAASAAYPHAAAAAAAPSHRLPNRSHADAIARMRAEDAVERERLKKLLLRATTSN
jgi:outer membrane biosynthesis protein TonB